MTDIRGDRRLKEIIIRAIPMPIHIRAFTIPDAQGDYNVYLNSKLGEEQQKKSFAHEKRHIENDDFYLDMSAGEIEKLTR